MFLVEVVAVAGDDIAGVRIHDLEDGLAGFEDFADFIFHAAHHSLFLVNFRLEILASPFRVKSQSRPTS